MTFKIIKNKHMKHLKLSKLTVATIFLFYAIQLSVAQQTPEHYCSHTKIKYAKSLLKAKTDKYKTVRSFNYDLKYHRLEFEIDPAVREITGIVTSYFTAENDNFNAISFDLNNSEMTVDSVKYHAALISNFSHNNNEVLINLPETVPNGTLDSVSVFYHGVPELSGFGSFIQDTHEGVPVIWTLSEPYGAMDWWVCKQSLDDKIDSIDIYISNPETYKAASNGVLQSETISGGIKTAHWKHRHPIPAYLIAIAVTNYTAYSDFAEIVGEQTVEILNYVYPEDLSYSQEHTPDVIDVLQFYSELFIPYPFADEKYGHAQFGWGGGMEHQTMSFMGNFNHHLMAHELAHQWFGDYITCGSWEDIWLNEAFATYLDGMTIEQGLDNGQYESFDAWKAGKIASVTSEPDGSVWVDDTTNVSRIFNGRLTYNKGALVLHTLRNKIGDEAFFTGIYNYLNDPDIANSYASTSDLQAHLEQTSSISLQGFLDDWFYGEGYPIYSVFYGQNESGNVNLTIYQTQSHESVDFFELDVPMQFIGTDKDTIITFSNTENGQQYSFDLDFAVNSVILDPHSDIITAYATVSAVDVVNESDKIILYPNPANNTIKIICLESMQANEITLLNAGGQAIKIIEKPDKYVKEIEVDISRQPQGIYFMKIKAGDKIMYKKFVKK